VALGAVVEILATDPGAPADLTAFSRLSGHPIVGHSEEAGVYRFLFQRAK
jgi:tRNA 2-thiouridine synthesizing protein A